ncbi:MFS transporter [Curtobacterium ammoniigenes]|uniref:MFS transporter n=1 Tax=Curtobacterium ammoniigenes TaxID=395387 RepID=UPI00082DB47D|nr:MFS transporter [Curtobacterium ammoniigenes]
MTSSAASGVERRRERGILSGALLLPTLGTVAIAVVAAFQSLAMTTIMPEISRDLNGAALYSLSFAAPLAAGVPGMVVAGNWSDRSGGRAVAWVAGALFALGTAVVMLATSMPMFLGGRLVEGFGGGALSVVLHVIVARLFPDRLHGPIFAAFAGAWVVPALVGPAIAGIVTDIWGWHWVFAGALLIGVSGFALLTPSLRHIGPPAHDRRPGWDARRIVWAVLAATAVLVVNLAPDLPAAVGGTVAAVSGVAALLAVRPLLPVGAFRARPGLPTVVVLRGLAAAAFFGAEAYVPYLLQRHEGMTPGTAGIALTVSAIAWATSSWLHGRLSERMVPALRAFRGGFALVIIGIGAQLVVAAAGAPWWLSVAGWFVAGGGMGFVYPRTSALTLRFAGTDDKGFASSALTIADSVGAVLGLAVAGGLLQGLGGAADRGAFAGVFVGMALIVALAVLITHRVGVVPPPRE